MNRFDHRTRTADAVALAVSLAVLGAGFAVIDPVVKKRARPPVAATTVAPATAAPAVALASEAVGSVRIALRIGDRVATATLADTPAADELVATLPVTLDLHDPFGQAKSGALPHRLDIAEGARTNHPVTGEIYYWPVGGDLAVFYDALGQAVPPPGLVRLGSVDTGLDALASRGDVTVTIQRAD